MDPLTPMMQQYHDIKRRYPGALLFFRLGDFYEMFYDDAVTGSRELEITLTSRHADRNGSPIPMCGVPYHAAGPYLNRLIRKGYRVAICDQVEDPRQAKGIVRREVTRVLTPGTTLDEGSLDRRENNFLAAVVGDDSALGAAFLDLSTGEFWALPLKGEEAWVQLAQELAYFRPSELILAESGSAEWERRFPESTSGIRTPQPDWVFNIDYARRTLLEQFAASTLEGFGLSDCPAAVAAAGALVHYVRQTQKAPLRHLTGLRLWDPAGWLKMDESTIQNLELVRGMDGNRRWTLLAVLDRTRTGMGARLLRNWLLRPLLEVDRIEARLDAVEELLQAPVDLSRLMKVLESIHDLERLLGRVTLNTAHPRDLLALRESLQRLPELETLLRSRKATLLTPAIDRLEDIVSLLERGLHPEAPASLADGGVIRSGYHAGLDELREIARSGKSFIAGLETRERQRTGIASLKVKFNKVFGYFIEVTRAHSHAVPDDYARKQTLVGSERYITPELKEYEEKVLGAEDRILELERQLFLEIREQVAAQAVRIQEMARLVGRLDALASLAEVAHRQRYVRPRLDKTTELRIRGGRHAVLEMQSGEPFVPNDLVCNTTTDQLLILTGPNMGGKSTWLRQNALIVILAQMGSFVPAAEVRIGLVDQVYTRVGASDNLARGRSTFMVEMIETARILNTATERSLVLLDEVGRGTATFDGLSIAWAVAEFLVTQPHRRARTLFATHYHELTRLEEIYPGVKNYCVTVRESGSQILFFHRVLAGVASKSYGIEVARLAGIPAPVIDRARQLLGRLERKELNLSGRNRSSISSDEVFTELQKTLF